MSNLPTRVFPLGGVDPAIPIDGSFRVDDKRYPSYVDAQVRELQATVLALQSQIATAAPAVASFPKIYTVADNGTTLPTVSGGIAIDSTGGPFALTIPSFAAIGRTYAISDVSALNTPGSLGFARNPFTLQASGPILWDPIAKALVNKLVFTQAGFQGTFLVVPNHPRLGSYLQQTADSLAVTNVLLGGVVQSSLTPSVVLPAQSGILAVDTTAGPMTALVPPLGNYSPYQLALVDTSGTNNALVRNPLTLNTQGGLNIQLAWALPDGTKHEGDFSTKMVLGGVNDWPMMRTVLLTLIPTTPPKIQVTG